MRRGWLRALPRCWVEILSELRVKSSVREEKGEREDRKKGGEIMINGKCE